MENGAKVKLRGVQIGEVRSIGTESGAGGELSKLTLKMDPGPFAYLPSNVEAEIKSSTAFGAKYVDLIVPPEGAGASHSNRVRCCTPAMSPSRSTRCSRICRQWWRPSTRRS